MKARLFRSAAAAGTVVTLALGAAASGAGCSPNRFAYNIASSSAGIHKLSGLEGNLHVFGQDYPLTASKSQAECGAVWAGSTNGWYFVSPPATAANPV